MPNKLKNMPLNARDSTPQCFQVNPCTLHPTLPKAAEWRPREIIGRFPVNGNRCQEKILFNDGSTEIRCYADHNPHYFKNKDGNLYPIHPERKFTKTTAHGESIELYPQNVVSVGRKKGKNKNKYLGLRPDDAQDGSIQLEFTIIDVEFDGIKQDLDNSEIGILTTRQRCRQLFPATEKSKPENNFKITFELHATSLDIEYREDLNELWCYEKKTGKFEFRIRKPALVDWDNKRPILGTENFIDHKLEQIDGKYIYTKLSTAEFNSAVLPSEYWIDADTYWGATSDGYVYATASGTSLPTTWNTVHGAVSGTASTSDGASNVGAGAAYHYYTPLVTPLESNSFLSRGFVFFNTNGFGDYCAAAVLSIRAYYYYDSTISVFEKSGGSSLGPGSFDEYTGSAFGSSAWSNARINITLNASGRSYINSDGKVGYSQFCLREYNHDVLNVAPTAETYYRNGMYFADYTSVEYDPYLSLTVYNYPSLSTPTYASVTTTTATLGATLVSAGTGTVSERGVVWDTATDPNINDNKVTASGTGTGAYTTPVTGLPPGTVIYFKGYAISSHGTGYSAQSSFTTSTAEPILTSPTVTNISSTTATLGATITSASGSSLTERGIVWDTSTGPTTADNKEIEDNTPPVNIGTFTKAVSGLPSGTEVFYRGYAINGVGTAYSAEDSFTTNIEPTVENPTVTDIRDTSAVLGATLSNAGGTVTERGIVWNLTGTPTTADNKQAEGGAAEGVYTDTILGLPAGTTIYYRGYAINEIGTGYSAEDSFITLETIVPSTDDTYVKILELDLPDSSTMKISDIGIRTPTGYVQPKILQWGSIQREIIKPSGLPRKTTFTVEVDDADGTLLALRTAGYVFRGQDVVFKIGPEDGSLTNEFRTIFSGKVAAAVITANASVIFSFTDVTADLFSNKIGRVFNTTDFPNLPDTVKWEVPNIIYGTVAKTGGAIPCQYVDTTTYKFCVARHPCKEITNVYKYGVLQTLTTHYTVSESVINGRTYTFITMLSDPEDTSKYDPAIITADVKGITDDNTSSGTLLENPADCLEDFLENYMGLDSGDIDTVLLATLQNIFTTFGWTCDIAFTEDLTMEDAVIRIASSFNIDIFTTWTGKLGVGLYQTDIAFPWEESTYNDLDDIYLDTYDESENFDCVNVIQYFYNRDYVNKAFDAEGTETHAAGVTMLGTEVPYEAKLWACRDATDAGEIAAWILALQKTTNDYIEFETSAIKVINNTELSRLAYVTHEFNPTGTDDHVYIKGIKIDVESMTGTLTCIKTGE